jgi:hypothetical protein
MKEREEQKRQRAEKIVRDCLQAAAAAKEAADARAGEIAGMTLQCIF